MTTPLFRALSHIKAQGRSPFHMPGHKGNAPYAFGDAFDLDVTEVEGADSLYQAQGPIADLEREYAALYGAKESLLSAGGGTLCVQAMLALAAREGQRVLCSRMLHASALSAMALLGLEPVWLWPRVAQSVQEGIPGMALPVTPAQVEEALAGHPGVAAVYLTSPDYTGQLCDIRAVARLCRGRGLPLLVDNAHGAHLALLRGWEHPIAQGADLCCDSLHKTLPVLTGGALLHLGASAPCTRQEAKAAMALFGSTSPSYPIMASADLALPYLREGYEREARPVMDRLAALGELARSRGLALPAPPREPLRLTLGYRGAGYDDEGFSRYIRGAGVEPEYLGGGVCILMASPRSASGDLDRLEAALAGLPSRPPLDWEVFLPPRPARALPLRAALLGEREALPLTGALVGRVAAAPLAACPPGIPLAAPGEVINGRVLARLKKSGVPWAVVVK